MALSYTTVTGRDLAPFISEVAEFRIRGFRAFPYLYEGSLAYEAHHFEGYLAEPRSLLVRVQDAGGKTVALATACPLASSGDIVAAAPRLFREAGLAPERYYYYAEILVEPAYRGRGIAKDIYAVRERHARSWGYRSLCLAVVQRPPDHPLRPPDYQPPERIWSRDGFTRTGIAFAYKWPTLQAGGGVLEQENTMAYWAKDL